MCGRKQFQLRSDGQQSTRSFSSDSGGMAKVHLCWAAGEVGIEMPAAEIIEVSQILASMIEAADSDAGGVCRIRLPENRKEMIGFAKLVMARSWTEVLFDDLVTMQVISKALPVVHKYCHTDQLQNACAARIQRSHPTNTDVTTTEAVIAYEQQSNFAQVEWRDNVILAIVKSVFPPPFIGHPAQDPGDDESDSDDSDESRNEKCSNCFPSTTSGGPGDSCQWCKHCNERLYTQYEYDHCNSNCFHGGYLWGDHARARTEAYSPQLLVQLGSRLLEKAAGALNDMIHERRVNNNKASRKAKKTRTSKRLTRFW